MSAEKKNISPSFGAIPLWSDPHRQLEYRSPSGAIPAETFGAIPPLERSPSKPLERSPPKSMESSSSLSISISISLVSVAVSAQHSSPCLAAVAPRTRAGCHMQTAAMGKGGKSKGGKGKGGKVKRQVSQTSHIWGSCGTQIEF